MKKKLNWIVLSGAVLGMGMAMPSCPGQQEMQSQVDALRASNMELSKKVQALSTQVTGISGDVTQMKQLFPQVTSVITGQKGALDRLDLDVKELQSKVLKGAKKRK